MSSKRYLTVVKNLPEDYEPYGKQPRLAGDCSSGCKFFDPLQEENSKEASTDWGVCTNQNSHRAGLLTFEHQGCLKFETSKKDDLL